MPRKKLPVKKITRRTVKKKGSILWNRVFPEEERPINERAINESALGGG